MLGLDPGDRETFLNSSRSLIIFNVGFESFEQTASVVLIVVDVVEMKEGLGELE